MSPFITRAIFKLIFVANMLKASYRPLYIIFTFCQISFEKMERRERILKTRNHSLSLASVSDICRTFEGGVIKL